MWGDRKRRKSKLEGKVVTEVALLSGIFYSKFRFKLNSVFLQLNKKYTSTAQSQTPKGMLMFHNAPHKGKSFHWFGPRQTSLQIQIFSLENLCLKGVHGNQL